METVKRAAGRFPGSPPGIQVKSLLASGVVHAAVLGAGLAFGLREALAIGLEDAPLSYETVVAMNLEQPFEEPPEEVLEDLETPEPEDPVEPELRPVEIEPEPWFEREEFTEVDALADLADFDTASLELKPRARTQEPTEPVPESAPATTPTEPTPAASSSSAAPVAVAAVLLEGPEPRYPTLSARLGEEGVVLCRLQVGVDGRVTGVEVLTSSGHERLDDAAVECLGTWVFQPATEDGEPVPASVDHRVVFRLG